MILAPAGPSLLFEILRLVTSLSPVLDRSVRVGQEYKPVMPLVVRSARVVNIIGEEDAGRRAFGGGGGVGGERSVSILVCTQRNGERDMEEE
jgi:hypothetical protein